MKGTELELKKHTQRDYISCCVRSRKRRLHLYTGSKTL